jgi:hypothetical protein
MTVTGNGIRKWKTAQKRNYVARARNSNPRKLPEFYDSMVTRGYRNKTVISWSRLRFDRLIIFQLLNKLPAFNTEFRTARHFCIHWGRQIHCISPHSLPLCILILTSHLPLDLPHHLFPSGFPIKIVYAYVASCFRVTSDFIILLIFSEKNQLWHSSIFWHSCHFAPRTL